MKITVVGAGYVGLANAVLLAQANEVVLLDIVKEKTDLINQRKSPIADDLLEAYLANHALNLTAVTDKDFAYKDADYVIIATPTNYDPEDNFFDTSAVDGVIADVTAINPGAVIVIKSTLPVGYTREAKERFGSDKIIFSPEFLREGKALHDNLYPARIVVGEKSERAEKFAALLAAGAIREKVPVLLTGSTEAEAIKLF